MQAQEFRTKRKTIYALIWYFSQVIANILRWIQRILLVRVWRVYVTFKKVIGRGNHPFWQTKAEKRYLEALKDGFGRKKVELWSNTLDLGEFYIQARLLDREEEKVVNIYQSIEKALKEQEHVLVVTGEPGAGKTILAKYLILRVIFPFDTKLDPLLREIGNKPAREWFPIYIGAQALAEFEYKEVKSGTDFFHWLACNLFEQRTNKRDVHEHSETEDPDTEELQAQNNQDSACLNERAVALLEAILSTGRALIVIDGVPTKFVEYIAPALDEFLTEYVGENLAFITVRPGVDIISPVARASFITRRFSLLPLTTSLQSKRRLLVNHHPLGETMAQSHKQKIDDFLFALTVNDRLRDLTNNPQWLVTGYTAYQDARDKFDTRGSIYEGCLTHIWQKSRNAYRNVWPNYKSAFKILTRVAVKSSNQAQFYCSADTLKNAIKRQKEEDEAKSAGSIPESKLIDDTYWEMIDRTRFFYPTNEDAVRLREMSRQRIFGSSLFKKKPVLRDIGDITLTFFHFGIQEYLVAQNEMMRLKSDDETEKTESRRLICQKLAVPERQESMAIVLAQQEDAPGIILDCLCGFGETQQDEAR